MRAGSAEKMERILQLAREMNYTPNKAAQVMRTSRSFQIGLIAHELYNPYTGRTLGMVNEELSHFGYSMLLRLVEETDPDWKGVLRDFSQNLMDGVLNHHPFLGGGELESNLRDLPCYTFDRSPEFSPAMDNREGGVLLGLQHLKGLGHDRIAIISGYGPASREPRRISAYKAFFASHSIVPPEEWMMTPGWRYEDGESAVENFLKSGCTACLAGNDLLGVGLCTGLRMKGFEVPKDFSIVSMDDTILSRMNRPQLTTVRPPFRALIRLTVKSLIDRIEGRKPSPFELLMPELVIRESSGPRTER